MSACSDQKKAGGAGLKLGSGMVEGQRMGAEPADPRQRLRQRVVPCPKSAQSIPFLNGFGKIQGKFLRAQAGQRFPLWFAVVLVAINTAPTSCLHRFSGPLSS